MFSLVIGKIFNFVAIQLSYSFIGSLIYTYIFRGSIENLNVQITEAGGSVELVNSLFMKPEFQQYVISSILGVIVAFIIIVVIPFLIKGKGLGEMLVGVEEPNYKSKTIMIIKQPAVYGSLFLMMSTGFALFPGNTNAQKLMLYGSYAVAGIGIGFLIKLAMEYKKTIKNK